MCYVAASCAAQELPKASKAFTSVLRSTASLVGVFARMSHTGAMASQILVFIEAGAGLERKRKASASSSV